MKWYLSHCQLVQQHAEAEHVAGRGEDRLNGKHFGRGPSQRIGGLAGGLRFGLGARLGQPEVGQLAAPLDGHQDVGALDVAVENTHAVQQRQAARAVQRQPNAKLGRQRSVAVQNSE